MRTAPNFLLLLVYISSEVHVSAYSKSTFRSSLTRHDRRTGKRLPGSVVFAGRPRGVPVRLKHCREQQCLKQAQSNNYWTDTNALTSRRRPSTTSTCDVIGVSKYSQIFSATTRPSKRTRVAELNPYQPSIFSTCKRASNADNDNHGQHKSSAYAFVTQTKTTRDY